MANDSKKKSKQGVATQVTFDYLKSPLFRTIRADGAIGSVTPNGNIHFALFSERPAIPQRVVYQINEDHELGDIVQEATVTRGSIVREMDIDIFLTVDVAEELKSWLDKAITDAKKQLSATRE